MSDPREARTMREALAAQILDECDEIVTRLEAIQQAQGSTEAKLAATTAALDEAGARFRQAVNDFAQQSRNELAKFVEERTAGVVSKTVEEQRAAIQELARLAFRAQIADQWDSIRDELRAASAAFSGGNMRTALFVFAGSLLGSSLSVGLFYFLTR